MSASTALSTVPWAVSMMTGREGSSPQGGPQEVHPVDLRHAQIGDDEVDVVLSQEEEAGLAVLGRVHLVAVAGELRGEYAPEVRLVVDHEDLLLLREHHVGSLPDEGRRRAASSKPIRPKTLVRRRFFPPNKALRVCCRARLLMDPDYVGALGSECRVDDGASGSAPRRSGHRRPIARRAARISAGIAAVLLPRHRRRRVRPRRRRGLPGVHEEAFALRPRRGQGRAQSGERVLRPRRLRQGGPVLARRLQLRLHGAPGAHQHRQRL